MKQAYVKMDSSKSDELEDDGYSLSIELHNPSALSTVKNILDSIEGSNEGVKWVKFEIGTSEPFEENLFNSPIDLEGSNYSPSEKDDLADIPTEDTGISEIIDSVGEIFQPESKEFKISSVLFHEEEPLVIKEIEEKLSQTKWSLTHEEISDAFRNLLHENKVNREKRDIASDNSKPYEYQLTEDAKDKVRVIEEHIQEKELNNIYPDINELEYECDICGQLFETGGGLGSHKYFKHEKTGDEDQQRLDEQTEDLKKSDTETQSEKTDEVRINPGTNKFYSASVLYNSAKPTLPRDIESRLEGTKWDSQRSSISATLGQLYSEGLVSREERRSERGTPYEYQLTEEGEEVISEAIEKVKENNVEDTFEDVVEGK